MSETVRLIGESVERFECERSLLGHRQYIAKLSTEKMVCPSASSDCDLLDANPQAVGLYFHAAGDRCYRLTAVLSKISAPACLASAICRFSSGSGRMKPAFGSK